MLMGGKWAKDNRAMGRWRDGKRSGNTILSASFMKVSSSVVNWVVIVSEAEVAIAGGRTTEDALVAVVNSDI